MPSILKTSVGTLLLLVGLAGTYTVNNSTHTNCSVKSVVGFTADHAPKLAVTSCGAFLTAPHSKKGVTNIENIADMNRTLESHHTVKIKATGWPIPVAYSISKYK